MLFRPRMFRILAGLWSVLIMIGCVPVSPGPRLPVSPVEPRVSIPERLPLEMTPLSEVQALNRAGLAVLLIMELPVGAFEARPRMPVVVDVEDHWAREEILSAVRLGLMPVSANHRFFPDRQVTRGGMAEILAGILQAKGIALVRRPLSSGLPADLPADHLSFPAVRSVLEAGLMEMDPDGRFFVSRGVSGLQASEYLNKIKRLLASGGGEGQTGVRWF